MSRPKSRRPSRRPTKKAGPAATGQRFKVALACLFLVGFLLVSLVLLAELRNSYRTTPPAPPEVSRPQAPFQDVELELENALLRSGIPLERIHIDRSGAVPLLVATGPYPPEPVLDGLRQRLERLSPELQLHAEPDRDRLTVDRGGIPLYQVRFVIPVAPGPVSTRPRVAIIIDDLGRDLEVVKALLEIQQPFTYAVLPNERHASQIATLAHRRGREVIVHIPMEPQGYPATDPGRNALFTNLDKEEIGRRFLSYLDRIPYATGGNNHMGSQFTADADGMRAVLETMKREGLFFVDSRTTGSSVAGREAERLGVPHLSRDVFLDNVADVGLIVQQIRKLVAVAEKRGFAVGICHPYPETVQALRQEARGLLSRGVVVVPVSALLKD